MQGEEALVYKNIYIYSFPYFLLFFIHCLHNTNTAFLYNYLAAIYYVKGEPGENKQKLF